MENFVIMPKEDWQNILNAVRSKTGKTSKYVSGELAAEILSIGASSVTITFTLDGTSYTLPSGYTWEEWWMEGGMEEGVPNAPSGLIANVGENVTMNGVTVLDADGMTVDGGDVITAQDYYTGEEEVEISFTVDGNEFTSIEGITWKDWVDEKTHLDFYYDSETEEVYYKGYTIYADGQHGSSENYTDEIMDGSNFYAYTRIIKVDRTDVTLVYDYENYPGETGWEYVQSTNGISKDGEDYVMYNGKYLSYDDVKVSISDPIEDTYTTMSPTSHTRTISIDGESVIITLTEDTDSWEFLDFSNSSGFTLDEDYLKYNGKYLWYEGCPVYCDDALNSEYTTRDSVDVYKTIYIDDEPITVECSWEIENGGTWEYVTDSRFTVECGGSTPVSYNGETLYYEDTEVTYDAEVITNGEYTTSISDTDYIYYTITIDDEEVEVRAHAEDVSGGDAYWEFVDTSYTDGLSIGYDDTFFYYGAPLYKDDSEVRFSTTVPGDYTTDNGETEYSTMTITIDGEDVEVRYETAMGECWEAVVCENGITIGYEDYYYYNGNALYKDGSMVGMETSLSGSYTTDDSEGGTATLTINFVDEVEDPDNYGASTTWVSLPSTGRYTIDGGEETEFSNKTSLTISCNTNESVTITMEEDENEPRSWGTKDAVGCTVTEAISGPTITVNNPTASVTLVREL